MEPFYIGSIWLLANGVTASRPQLSSVSTLLDLQPALATSGSSMSSRASSNMPSPAANEAYKANGFLVSSNIAPFKFYVDSHEAIVKRVHELLPRAFAHLESLQKSSKLKDLNLDELGITSDFIILSKSQTTLTVAVQQFSFELLNKMLSPQKMTTKDQTLYLSTVRRAHLEDDDSSDGDELSENSGKDKHVAGRSISSQGIGASSSRHQLRPRIASKSAKLVEIRFSEEDSASNVESTDEFEMGDAATPSLSIIITTHDAAMRV